MVRKEKLEEREVWVYDKIKTANGKTMIYYREIDGLVTDFKTKVI